MGLALVERVAMRTEPLEQLLTGLRGGGGGHGSGTNGTSWLKLYKTEKKSKISRVECSRVKSRILQTVPGRIEKKLN